MIQTPPSLAVWNLKTQCPGIKQQWIPVTRFPGIPLTPFPVLLGIIPVLMPPVFPIPVTLCAQIYAVCPGIIVKTRCPPLLRAVLSSVPPKKRRTRRRRLARRAANRKEESSSAASLTQDARWANQRTAVPAGATQQLPETSDPTSAKRTAVYPPSRIVGGSPTNENSPFQIGLESSRIPGLYKLAVPDHQQDTQARTFRANSSGSGTSSPPYLLPYTKPFSGRPSGSSITGPTREAGETLRLGSGIVYPLQPRVHRPDTRITVDAALPEPAAFQRQDLPHTVVEIGSPIQSQKPPATRRRASRKPSRKRRRNRSTAVFRPAKRSPSHGHWCD